MEDKSLKDKVDEIYEAFAEAEKPKKKKIKIPRKAKVKKGKMRKGWIGVIKIQENGSISGEKVQIEGSAFTTKDKFTHATDGREILFWDGKFPVLLQPEWSNNPIEIRQDPKEKNQVYGQEYIRAKMIKDAIKAKGAEGMGKLIIWILIGGACVYGLTQLL